MKRCVQNTLYIPLYGKALVSRRSLFLDDPSAEALWAAEGFPLRGKAKSKWLAYYMGIRAAVFDDWVRQQLGALPDAVVLHLGCGLDSRAERVAHPYHSWIDVDFPDVIHERQRYIKETDTYRMLAADVREEAWIDTLPYAPTVIVVMEGVSMYLTPEELAALTRRLTLHYGTVRLLTDCYSEKAAKLSKYRNPVNEVGVSRVYGLDDPTVLCHDGFAFYKEHPMTPSSYIHELHGMERFIFKTLYAGRLSKALYRLYEFRSI